MLLLSVGELCDHLEMLLAADEVLADVWVQGEVSNLKRHSSGHYYFRLKDDSAAIDAAMWRSHVTRLTTPLEDGHAVLAHGRVSLYKVRGQLQLYVDIIQPAGVGLLHARFEELKARLDAEGLFAISRKRPLPPLPRTIGVATAPESAALQDMVNILRRRYPLARVLLAPCLVQGARAPASIVQALDRLYAAGVDVVLLARGGGSIEDLWSFNEEVVARAVFTSPVPVVTGVGHETDVTIVDYVADVRAPTPSAAAELVAPDVQALQQMIADGRTRLTDAVGAALANRQQALEQMVARLWRHDPRARLAQDRQMLDDLVRRAQSQSRQHVQIERLRLEALRRRLDALDPRATLARGYALVQRAADGQPVQASRQVQPGERLLIELHDGTLTVDVAASGAAHPHNRRTGDDDSEE